MAKGKGKGKGKKSVKPPKVVPEVVAKEPTEKELEKMARDRERERDLENLEKHLDTNAKTFDEIPSTVKIIPDEPADDSATVSVELAACRKLLSQRKTVCPPILPPPRPPLPKMPYITKMYCVCRPSEKSCYSCKHTGNVIIDRNVLTGSELITHLAKPRKYHEPRQTSNRGPRFYRRNIVLPACTTRVDQLAQPSLKHVRNTLQSYKHLLRKQKIDRLRECLKNRDAIKYYPIDKAMSYISEEQRLKRVAISLKKKYCLSLTKQILADQSEQIEKIMCLLFYEMKDFLLTDRFVYQELTPLGEVILGHIRSFTDQEFHKTSNLHSYQRALATNITAWINRFISNLNINISPEPENLKKPLDCFVPVDDYISYVESCEAEGESNDYCEEEFKPRPPRPKRSEPQRSEEAGEEAGEEDAPTTEAAPAEVGAAA